MTFPKPRADLKPNTADFERLPLVKPTGFREYDARWLYPQDINLMGLNAIGLGLATLAGRRGVAKRFVVGHDYRSYSAAVKQALMTGLLAGGAEVHDIGLALSPMAYFAQFALDVEGVAMVTASHNDNGWTGIKMGFERPLTFGPDEMTALKEIVLAGAMPDGARRALRVRARHGRALHRGAHRPSQAEAQAQGGGGLRQRHRRRLGAAGAGGHRLRGCPARLRPRLHLPALQPQPRRHEDAARHRATLCARTRPMSASASTATATAAAWSTTLGHEIFADKVGVMLARDLSARHDKPVFVADVKSTGLFMTDPVLLKQRREDALLEDRPLLHEALHPRAEGAGRLREVRPLLLPAAARARLRRRPRRRHRRLRHARPQSRPSRSPTSRTRCPRPGARPPCRRTAPTR